MSRKKSPKKQTKKVIVEQQPLMKEPASPKKKSNVGKSPIWNNKEWRYVLRKRGEKGRWLSARISKKWRGEPTVRDVLFVIQREKLNEPRYRYSKVNGETKRSTTLDSQLFGTFVMKGMIDNAISNNRADVTAAIILYNKACKDRGLTSLVSMEEPVYNIVEATEKELFIWLASEENKASGFLTRAQWREQGLAPPPRGEAYWD